MFGTVTEIFNAQKELLTHFKEDTFFTIKEVEALFVLDEIISEINRRRLNGIKEKVG